VTKFIRKIKNKSRST